LAKATTREPVARRVASADDPAGLHARQAESGNGSRLARDQCVGDSPHRGLELLGYGQAPARLLEVEELARVVAQRCRRFRPVRRSGEAAPGHSAGGRQQFREPGVPGAGSRLERRRGEEMAEHDVTGRDVAPLVAGAALKNAPGRGLVHLVGVREMKVVTGE
jgi:hypothetical protein